MYGTKFWKQSRIDEFDKYYEQNRNTPFNFKQQIYLYTRADVTLLRLAAIKFSQIIWENGRFYPFTECLTLSAVSVRLFRTNFLGTKRIGIIGDNSKNQRINQSQLALKYFDYLRETKGYKIQSRDHGGESRVDGFYVDAMIHNYPSTEEFPGTGPLAFSVHGCFFHCCLQ
jgi:hypothetical protein